ncbi:MAG: glutamine synthetase type III [Chitinophagaceae bacterium]|nr:MAG: glutamine synthetase type III [Chitinophagaceae bacterium]
MSNPRFSAISKIADRNPVTVKIPSERISDYFGSNVFDDESMRKFMPEDVYKSVKSSIRLGTKIDRKVADQVATSMQAWAISHNATHFTHWFQPLTGATAEKHDSFFTIFPNTKGIENFIGDSLVQQEPDASSLPSGGIRNTFEARGYTAWDPSSPAFIMEIGSGKTLCIPTIYVSYTGESLDFKAPLLKSQNALDEAATEVVKFFDKNVNYVVPTLGWEQEYFLVDLDLYFNRPDLVLTGRCLLGNTPAKNQQLEDHYFGSIPERAFNFMVDFEKESHKLGIPVRTRHNEVAPGQFECAPIFEEVNLAVDHNQLIMDLMDRVARKHKLKVLLHEKPFASLNGSGKHNNWSLMTDAGKNLLAPGTTPKNNLSFLTFFVNTIAAVNNNADLLRASIASAGNDHRLGANEAPPAIISIYIGEHLTALLEEIEERVKKGPINEMEKQELKLDIHNKIPDLLLDNSDRNRTSPFAFTGNKFEFRAVGSTLNCAGPMTVLNTIMADQLKKFKAEVDNLISEGEKKDGAILRVLRRNISESKRILFEGDNYSESWAKEAEKRGLSNLKNTPDALALSLEQVNIDVFTRNKVLTEKEIHSRVEIQMEQYAKKIQIESRVIGDLAVNHIIPAAINYQNKLIVNANGLKNLGFKNAEIETQLNLLKRIQHLIESLRKDVVLMVEARKKANEIEDSAKRAKNYATKVKPTFDSIRYSVDKLERYIEDESWPMPKYRELLFIR